MNNKDNNIYSVQLSEQQAEVIQSILPYYLKLEANKPVTREKKGRKYNKLIRKQIYKRQTCEEQVINENQYSDDSSQSDEDYIDSITIRNTKSNSKNTFQQSDTLNWIKQCIKMLQRMDQDDYFAFCQCDLMDGLEYMDLSIIDSKCRKRQYETPFCLKQDLEKMFSLFYQHNIRGSEIYNKTVELQRAFQKEYNKWESSIEKIKILRLNSEKFEIEPRKVTMVAKKQSSVKWNISKIPSVHFEKESSVVTPPSNTSFGNTNKIYYPKYLSSDSSDYSSSEEESDNEIEEEKPDVVNQQPKLQENKKMKSCLKNGGSYYSNKQKCISEDEEDSCEDSEDSYDDNESTLEMTVESIGPSLEFEFNYEQLQNFSEQTYQL